MAVDVPDPVQTRRADNNERFVAFAFAGADIMVEVDAALAVTYAAGAFRSKFGRPPETFLGTPVRDLIAPADHDVLDSALTLLNERGRLLPLLIRLADAARTPLALAGVALAPEGAPRRLCLSLARPPAPLATVRQASTPHALAREAEAGLRAGTSTAVGLLEVCVPQPRLSLGEDVAGALQRVAPCMTASEVAPGRFGLLGLEGMEGDLLSVAGLLEEVLRKQGIEVGVATRQLQLTHPALTPVQAARALRQALNVFAREGVRGLDTAGFEGGLVGYVRKAGAQAASLRQVIRNRQFSLVFQPIVSLSDRATHHYEALIRPVISPGGAYATPQEFALVVEALGLAGELDLAVAAMACEAAAAADAPVAFNISGQSFQNAAFRERLVAIIAASPAHHSGLITVEMTETAEVEDVAEAARTGEALRALGVAFCLDDFGAGAADIRLLRALAPDIVKLDGSYVPGIAQDGRERAMVVGMIEIARATGAAIVAERVETEAEAESLRQLGVQYGQGWLFARPGPLPARAVRRAVRRVGEKESWG